MDFLCFYFPLFCIHWLMGNHLLPANPVGDVDHLRTDTVGIQSSAQMGRCLGKVAHTLSDCTLLRSYAVLRRFLFACILLIINHISFIKLLA